MLRDLSRPVSLDVHVDKEKKTTLGELLVCDQTASVIERVIISTTVQEIKRIMATHLTRKQRFVINLYFGLGTKPHSLGEISNILETTKQNVAKIKNSAIRTLQEKCCDIFEEIQQNQPRTTIAI